MHGVILVSMHVQHTCTVTPLHYYSPLLSARAAERLKGCLLYRAERAEGGESRSHLSRRGEKVESESKGREESQWSRVSESSRPAASSKFCNAISVRRSCLNDAYDAV